LQELEDLRTAQGQEREKGRPSRDAKGREKLENKTNNGGEEERGDPIQAFERVISGECCCILQRATQTCGLVIKSDWT